MSAQVSQEMTGSYTSAAEVAKDYPEPTSSDIVNAAAQAFTDGKSWAIAIALVMTVIGLGLVVALFPRKQKEEAYYAQVQGAQESVTPG